MQKETEAGKRMAVGDSSANNQAVKSEKSVEGADEKMLQDLFASGPSYEER